MAKNKIEFEIKSYGLYTAWDRKSKLLPKIVKHTLEIEAAVGVEFGFILSIRKGKGEVLEYCIEHPPIKDEDGEWMPPFTGTYFIDSNDFQFFIGDTVWEPVEEKRGEWVVSVSFKGKEIARKCFMLK